MFHNTFLVSRHGLLTKQMACRLSSRRSPVSVHQALPSATVRNFSKEHNPNEDEAHKEGVKHFSPMQATLLLYEDWASDQFPCS